MAARTMLRLARRAATVLGGAAVLAGCGAGGGRSVPAPLAPLAPDTLSVVTFNIWHNRGDWPRRLEVMVQGLGEWRPDVICLQEVLQNPELPNQAETIARALGGYTVHFVSADHAGSAKRYGNAILTRHPVLARGERLLSPHSDYRAAAHVRISLRGRPVDVYTTHLHYAGEAPGADGSPVRREQITDLLRFVAETGAGGPAVLTGDFNATPDAPELRLLDGAFTDSYAALHPGAAARNRTTLNPSMFANPRRIDYVFHTPQAMTPVAAEVLFDQPADDGFWASDHLAVGARFVLGAAPARPQ